MRSSISSFTTGLSNEEKFNEGYKTRGRLLHRLVNVDKNVSAVKLLFTRTLSAMPEMKKNDHIWYLKPGDSENDTKN